MTNLGYKVIQALEGKTLCTAESCTGGGIGSHITAIPGSSAVYKGGIISYCDEIKHRLLHVDLDTLVAHGAVSAQVAQAMAVGAKKVLAADIAVSVTGLAGPGSDDYGNQVGTVFLGYADDKSVFSREFHFAGDRETVRDQAIRNALLLILEMNT